MARGWSSLPAILTRVGTGYDVVLFLHLVGAPLFVAGIAVAGVSFEAARRRDRPAEIASLLGIARMANYGSLALVLVILALTVFK